MASKHAPRYRKQTTLAVSRLMDNGRREVQVQVWIPAEVSGNKEAVWTLATVLAQSGPHITLRTENSQSLLQLDLRKTPIARANPDTGSAPDNLTSMHYVNEPSILHALDIRAANDMPYTFLGSVLVYVNPLQRLEEPEGLLGSSSQLDVPHPYMVAETALQQMSFVADVRRSRNPKPRKSKQVPRKEKDEFEVANQSIITSGESGAGKTECTKMLLRQLMARAKPSSKQHAHENSLEVPLDERVIQTSPIVESFGNAMTLRNSNSSRFGKLIKLFFKQVNPKALSGSAQWQITCASVESYLLEKSRVVHQGAGERGFRVFYEVLEGSTGKERRDLGLDAPPIRKGSNIGSCKGAARFAYLSNPKVKDSLSGRSQVQLDQAHYSELLASLQSIGLDKETVTKVFQVVSAVLHLGNVEFVDVEETQGNVAKLVQSGRDPGYEGSYSPMNWAAELLDVNPDQLRRAVLEHELVVGSERTILKRNAVSAKFATDAIAKGVYSLLFEWIVAKINTSLGVLENTIQSDSERERQPTIGILDIFGFESFATNRFPQLLINLANEALNATFAKSILVHEHELFRKEGLVLAESDSSTASLVDTGALDLLLGHTTLGRSRNRQVDLGLLVAIDSECQSPEPSDKKLNSTLHRLFDSNAYFVPPHPKDAADTFIVQHYAGAVTYNVDGFVHTNNDRLPAGMDAVITNSQNKLVVEMFDYFHYPSNVAGAGLATGKARKGRKSLGRRPFPSSRQLVRKQRNTSIVAKFRQQVQNLLNQLEETRSLFVRCIKPNPEMSRRPGWWSRSGMGWFNRQYVSEQLRVLSIPQTAQVLREGLPTRMPYAQFLKAYKTALPKKAIRLWKARGNADKRAFVSALFFAFRIESEAYRLGHTLVFFESGKLKEMEKILLGADNQDEQHGEIAKRFSLYYMRNIWRRAMVKVLTINRFMRIWKHVKVENEAATVIQSFLRKQAAIQDVQKLREVREAERRKEARRAERIAKRKKAKKARERKLKKLQKEKELAERRAQEEKEREAKERELQLEMEKLAREKEEAEEQDRIAREKEEHIRAETRARIAKEAREKRLKDIAARKRESRALPQDVEKVSEASRHEISRKQASHITGRKHRRTKLVRAASGKQSIVVDDLLSDSEVNRPLISAEEHLSKLEDMVREGTISPAEFKDATPKVVKTAKINPRMNHVRTPSMTLPMPNTQRGRGSSASRMSVGAHEPNPLTTADDYRKRVSFEHNPPRRPSRAPHNQQFICASCGKTSNTMFGGATCQSCGQEAEEVSDKLTAPAEGASVPMVTEFDVDFDTDIAASARPIKHVLSQHEDWVGGLPFRDGQVLFRVAPSELALDHTTFTQIRLFVIQLRWLTREPLNWKVRHTFASHCRFHEELTSGRLAELVPRKLRAALVPPPPALVGLPVEKAVEEREAAQRDWLAALVSVLSRCPASGKRSLGAVLEHRSFDAFFEMPFYSSLGRIRRPVSRVGDSRPALVPTDSLKKRSKKRSGLFSLVPRWTKRYMRLDDEAGVLLYAKSRAALDDPNQRKRVPYREIARAVVGVEDSAQAGGFVEHSFGEGGLPPAAEHVPAAHPARGHSEAALDLEVSLRSGRKLVFRTPSHAQADVWATFLNDRATLKARVYTVDELNRFPEAFIRAGSPVPDTAVCFSGGGSRSLAAATGQLRALVELGVLDASRVGYMSGVSGGAWASGIFTFFRDSDLARSDRELLGAGVEEEDLAHLSLGMLQQDPPALGRTAKASLTSILKRVVLGNSSFLTTESHELWGKVIAEAFLTPFGIGGDVPFMEASLAEEARNRNPLLKNFDAVTARPNRPFWICNGAILGPEVPRLKPRDLVPLQMSAMYVGSPMLHQITYDRKSRWSSSGSALRYKKVWVGGGFLESFAFGSTAPLSHQQIPFPFELPPLPELSRHRTRHRGSRRPQSHRTSTSSTVGSDSDDSTGARRSQRQQTLEDVLDPDALHGGWGEVAPPDLHQVRVEPPAKPFSLKHALAISSHMVGMEYTKSSLKIRFNQHDLYWSPNPELFDEVEETMFDIADGYLIDNTGLLAVLQRNVKRAVVFVNGMGALTPKYNESKPETWVGDEIPALFGYTRQTETGRFKRNGQVFASEDLLRLHDGIADKIVNEEPVIVTQKYPVLENEWLGIVGGYEVEVMWFFNHSCASFNRLLSDEVQEEILKGEDGQLANFPGYHTFGQVNSGDVALSSVQINLLAIYAEWMVRQKASKLKRWFPPTV